MRIFISLLFVFVLGIVVGVGLYMFTFLNGGVNQATSEPTERIISYWSAPMDANYRREEPGQSPMGMDLVPVYEDELNGKQGAPDGAIKIDPVYIHTLGVKTAETSQQEFGRSLRAFGRIDANTRLEHAVDVRTKGWIVDLATDAVGDYVQKGDLLFTFYSPDLMTAQSDYLIGRSIGNSEQRLRLLGMDDKSIHELKKHRAFLEKTPFYAPIAGTVSVLNVRKGAHVNEGGNIMMIHDLSQLWVSVDVPIRDVQFLKIGTSVKVTVPETGQVHETVVDFIHPVNDPQSRTVKVRLIIDNTSSALKPNMYVDAVFKADTKFRLAIPTESIMYSSMGSYVMEDLGEGYFKPVIVETGITENGLTEIINGLKSGQRVVTSGQFMLDAETNLKGGMEALKSVGGHDHGK